MACLQCQDRGGKTLLESGDAHIKLAGDEQAAKLKEVLRRVQDANLQIKYDKETEKWGEHMKTILNLCTDYVTSRHMLRSTVFERDHSCLSLPTVLRGQKY